MTCHLSTAWKTESGGFGNSIISLIIVILISYCVLSHREKGPVALLHNLLRLDEQVGLKEMYLSSVNRAVLSCFPQAASLQAELHNSSLPALFLSTPTKQVMSSVGPLVGLSLYQVLTPAGGRTPGGLVLVGPGLQDTVSPGTAPIPTKVASNVSSYCRPC